MVEQGEKARSDAANLFTHTRVLNLQGNLRELVLWNAVFDHPEQDWKNCGGDITTL